LPLIRRTTFTWYGHVTNIYYRKKEQSGWGSIELVSDESEYQGDWIGADMAIDSNGNIHVAWEGYNKDSWYNLFYRKKSSGKWESIETINDYDLTNTECYSLSIALDSNNNPLIAWEGYDYDSDLAEINYSEKVAGSWQTTTLAESDNAVQPSITLDRKDGIIYIIYQDREAGELRLVKNDGSWGAPQTLYVFSDHKSYGNYGTSALWAKYPNNTNIPYIGFICIFYWATKTNPYTSGVYFYSSSDLSFGPKPPSKPTGLFCNGQTNPSGIQDPTPSFSAIYSDPDGKNSSACEIHVATSQDKLDAPDMWDSGWINDNTASGERCSDKTYAGAPLNVEQNIVYYWKIRFKDADGLEGAWSDPAYFITGDPGFLEKVFFRPYQDAKGSVKLTFHEFQETLNKIQELREYADLYQKGFIIPHATVKNKIKVLFHDLQELLNKISLPNFHTDFLSREDIIPYSTLLNKVRLLFYEDIDILVQTFLPEHKDLYSKLLFNLYSTIASKIEFIPLLDILTRYYQPNYDDYLSKTKASFSAYQTALSPIIDVWKDDAGIIHKEQVLRVSYGLSNYKTYMRFDLSGLDMPLSAHLVLVPTVSSWENTNIGIYRIQENWTEDNIPDNLSCDPNPACIFSLGNDKVEVDITSLTQGWIGGTYPNYGILLKCTDDNYYITRTLGSSRHSLVNYRPYLVLYMPQEFIQKILLVQPPPPEVVSWRWKKSDSVYAVGWERPQDERLIGFNVYHSTDLGTTWRKVNTDRLPTSQRTFEVTGIRDFEANYNDFAVTSVIQYHDGTILEGGKRKARDIWGVRYILNWDPVEDAVKYRIYEGKL